MTHQTYSSIENYYNDKHMNKLKEIYQDDNFIAQEKIHGANFSFQFYYDPINPDYRKICCSSRSQRVGILTETDGPDFYGTKNILLEKYKDIYLIRDKLFTTIDGILTAQIYGELFGGVYDNNGVKKITSAKPIQKGINYNPNNDFIIFDIRVQTYDKQDFYLAYNEINNLIQDTNLKFLQAMHFGKLEDLLKLNPVFESTIYAYYDLPKVTNNYAEGYVVKKYERRTVGDYNPIVKIKSPTFAEVTKNNHTVNHELNSKVKNIQDNYINKNRVDAYKSKYPDAEKKVIICGVIDDAIEEYLKLNPEELTEKEVLTDKVRKAVSGKILQFI